MASKIITGFNYKPSEKIIHQKATITDVILDLFAVLLRPYTIVQSELDDPPPYNSM